MRSIRNQLVASLAVGIGLLTVAAGAGLYAYVDEVLERGLDAALAAKAEAIAGSVHVEDDGQPHLRAADGAGGGDFPYQVWRADGRTLARSGPAAAAGPLPIPARRSADAKLPGRTSGRVLRLSFVAQPDEDEFDAHRPPRPPSTERLMVVVAHDRRPIDGPLAVLLSGLLFAAVVVTAGMLGVVTWGVRRGLRPLADVARLADRIGPATLGVRFPAGDAVPDELRPIGVKLNELLDRLQAAFDRERRFAAAIAHELRTPVAELRSACEVAVRWPDDGRAAPAAVTEALAIAREMGAAVDNLLLLVRCQAGADQVVDVPVKLSDAVAEAWDRCGGTAGERGVTLSADVSHAVRTDPRVLAVVLRNVFDNAASHAPHGSRCRVHATATGGRVTLHVGNPAGGLMVADLPRLAEPFWRHDAARTGGNHAGLGLAIVDVYSRLVGIEFATHLLNDNWFEVTLTCPGVDGGGVQSGGTQGPPV